MKKMSLVLVLVAMFALVLAGTGFAGVVKATGGVEYVGPGFFLNFNVHERAGTAWGEVKISNPNGLFARGKVLCVKIVDPKTVRFAVQIVATNMPTNPVEVLIQVQDNGTPGRKGDLVWGKWYFIAGAAVAACPTVTPDGPYSVTKGNLVVHGGEEVPD